MAKAKETVSRTLMVALVLSVAFSVVVSTAAVMLRPAQVQNQNLDIRSNILAAAGIGNPGRFFGMLRAHGLQIEEMALPDHHDFLDDPFRGVSADVILVTEKDAVKCRQLENINNDPRLWVVPVSARIDAALATQIVEKCRGRPTA